MSTSPLREPSFFVLAGLASGPTHGYGLVRAIEEMSDGRVKLRAGTLYSTLDRLCRDGFVERLDSEPGEGPRRQPYAITVNGRALLHDEAARLEANATAARLALAQGVV